MRRSVVSGRTDDLALLERALTLSTLDEDTTEAFTEMREKIASGERNCLSAKQRTWVSERLGEVAYENLVSSGKVSKVVRHRHPELAPCTAECPAFTPPSLRNLPKKPPQRRTEGT
jgi:hypothetical protein